MMMESSSNAAMRNGPVDANANTTRKKRRRRNRKNRNQNGRGVGVEGGGGAEEVADVVTDIRPTGKMAPSPRPGGLVSCNGTAMGESKRYSGGSEYEEFNTPSCEYNPVPWSEHVQADDELARQWSDLCDFGDEDGMRTEKELPRNTGAVKMVLRIDNDLMVGISCKDDEAVKEDGEGLKKTYIHKDCGVVKRKNLGECGEQENVSGKMEEEKDAKDKEFHGGLVKENEKDVKKEVDIEVDEVLVKEDVEDEKEEACIEFDEGHMKDTCVVRENFSEVEGSPLSESVVLEFLGDKVEEKVDLEEEVEVIPTEDGLAEDTLEFRTSMLLLVEPPANLRTVPPVRRTMTLMVRSPDGSLMRSDTSVTNVTGLTTEPAPPATDTEEGPSSSGKKSFVKKIWRRLRLRRGPKVKQGQDQTVTAGAVGEGGQCGGSLSNSALSSLTAEDDDHHKKMPEQQDSREIKSNEAVKSLGLSQDPSVDNHWQAAAPASVTEEGSCGSSNSNNERSKLTTPVPECAPPSAEGAAVIMLAEELPETEDSHDNDGGGEGRCILRIQTTLYRQQSPTRSEQSQHEEKEEKDMQEELDSTGSLQHPDTNATASATVVTEMKEDRVEESAAFVEFDRMLIRFESDEGAGRVCEPGKLGDTVLVMATDDWKAKQELLTAPVRMKREEGCVNDDYLFPDPITASKLIEFGKPPCNRNYDVAFMDDSSWDLAQWGPFYGETIGHRQEYNLTAPLASLESLCDAADPPTVVKKKPLLRSLSPFRGKKSLSQLLGCAGRSR